MFFGPLAVLGVMVVKRRRPVLVATVTNGYFACCGSLMTSPDRGVPMCWWLFLAACTFSFCFCCRRNVVGGHVCVCVFFLVLVGRWV